MGNILRAFGPDKPDIRGMTTVKNQGLETLINSLSGDYKDARQTGLKGLGDWMKGFLTDTPAAGARADQEQEAFDPFYNGGYGAEHDYLRSQEDKALTDADKLAMQYAVANSNRSRIGGEGTGSSYWDRVTARQMGDVAVQSALRRAGQQRSDYESEMQAPIALAGRRQSLADAFTNRSMQPFQMENQVYGADSSNLSNLANLYHGNETYGLYKKRSGLDKAADIIDAINGQLKGDIGTAASVAGGMGGGGGGGGSSL